MPKRIYVGKRPLTPKTPDSELREISRKSRIPVDRLRQIAAGRADPTSAELKALNVNEA